LTFHVLSFEKSSPKLCEKERQKNKKKIEMLKINFFQHQEALLVSHFNEN